MNPPSFRPSQVALSVPPLTGTMGRSEREHAATLLLRALVREGDTWQALAPPQIGLAIRADLEERVEPISALSRNPFFRPDIPDLVAAGFAEFDRERRISFTDKGLEALSRWVRPSNGGVA